MVQLAFRSTGTQKFSRRELLTRHNERGSLMTGVGGLSSSGKLKLQFVSGRQKAADYVKILNDLSLAQEGRCLCGEEWIFQQDIAAIHNASITNNKK